MRQTRWSVSFCCAPPVEAILKTALSEHGEAGFLEFKTAGF